MGRGQDPHLFVLGYDRGPCGQRRTSEGCLLWGWLILVQIYILNLLCNCVSEEATRRVPLGCRHAVSLFGCRSPEVLEHTKPTPQPTCPCYQLPQPAGRSCYQFLCNQISFGIFGVIQDGGDRGNRLHPNGAILGLQGYNT